MAKGRKWLKGIGIGIAALVAILLGLIFFTEPGQAVQDLWRRGMIQAAVFKGKKGAFKGGRKESLTAIHTALMLYHDSEEAFPPANSWMDAIEGRIVTNDLSKKGAEKKLVRPDLRDAEGLYGYAFNVKAAGKYKDDIGPATTALVYESKQTTRNASGDPATDADTDAMSIDVAGTVKN